MDPRVEALNKATIVETIIEATDSINKEVQAAQANPLLLNILITKLRQELKYAEAPAKDFIVNEKKATRGEAIPSKQGEAAFALRTVIRAVEAAKKGIVVSKTTQGQELLVKLGEKSYTSFSVASAIEANLADYLIGNKNITVSAQPGVKSDFERAFENLRSDSITAAKLIGDSIISLARDGKIPGLTEEVAKVKFKVEEEGKGAEKSRRELNERENLIRLLQINPNYIRTEEQWEILKAISSPENFKEFVQKIEKEMGEKPEIRGLRTEDFEKKLSEQIELKIALFFDHLFAHLDKSKPTKFYREVTQEDPFYGFQVVFDRLNIQLSQLADQFEASTDPEIKEFLKKRLFKKSEERFDEERVYGENKIKYTGDRIRPLPVRFESKNIADFINYLRILTSHEQELREFGHNVKAMYFQPAKEGGFYAQLANYVEIMRTSDIDQFMALPDSEIYMIAFSLYNGFMQEEYAKYDWMHPSSLLVKIFSHTNKVEDEILETLKNEYKDKGVDEWRLRRAVSLAVASSLGIFMTDVENASYADPNLNPDGTPAYASFWRNDTASLTPLNPFPHVFWRWQAERSLMADLLFLPVGGKLPGLFNAWDHRVVFEEMQKYRESYAQRSLNPLADGRKRLIEIMNIARGGGPISRSGWRTFFAYDEWLIFEKEGGLVTDKLNYLESWKSIENIGFEVLFNYIAKYDKSKVAFFNHNKDIKENIRATVIDQRKDFFKHIYSKYLNTQATDAEFNKFFDALVKEAEESDKPENVYKLAVYKALTGVLKARVPTKFLRLERGRLTKGGKEARLWDSIQNELGISVQEFDRIIKYVILGESLLRQKVSQKMIKWLEDNPKKKFNEFEVDYRLTEDELGSLLRGKATDDDINLAKRALRLLLNKVNDSYLKNFAEKLEARNTPYVYTDLPFAVAPEELEMRLINFRTAGPRVLSRLMTWNSKAETVIAKHLEHFFEYLQETSINGKHDTSEIVKAIQEIQVAIEAEHGKEQAYNVAYDLAAVTISFFKKDTISRFLLAKPFLIGRKNSLAAEYAGTLRGVWEWEADEINRFVYELERRRILPKEPYDLSKGDIYTYTEQPKEINLFGKKFKLGGRKDKREPDYSYFGGKLRKEFGGALVHQAWEVLNTLVPLFLLYLLYRFIKEALAEAEGKKKQ
ncbi:hypothetical protein HY612_00365 [Candidatus Roizmanbacteria bacterium]|nr:hypothetical protein [Candidatus Roizmanbacteria bacterium]